MKSIICLLLLSISGLAQGFVSRTNTRSAFVPSLTLSTASSRASSKSSMTMNAAEKTYIMIKPDGVQRGIVGNIISRFEQKGYKLCALKTKQASKELLEQHYKDLVEKPFFPKLRDYMLSGPVVCMVWEGKEAVATGRKMLGATNPLESAPGTIRGDFCIEVGRNICHGSDSVENAEREIGLWFEDGEVLDWTDHSFDWVYE
ncbi:flagellar-associated nucleoside diphosphate kinase [Nitzschia inconspicua]|uniref:Nucleoside diphosphate kinase n=1 Tax=Nitzschia inconspicua TaxID=303405 RepID=A0A9K3LHM4_9STRA|nr:flagellar-associated nucleoside diphosphate kinase [Nitzschia inconspicua]